MTTLREQIDFAHNGGLTRRYHTRPVIQGDNVAEHSYNTSWLLYLIAGENLKSNMIMAAITHDMAEHIMGDIPAPTKRAFTDLAQFSVHEDALLEEYGFAFPLTNNQKRVLKLADIYASVLTCIKERTLGNRHLDDICVKFISYALELNPVGAEKEVFDVLVEKWNDLTEDPVEINDAEN
jgi:5'-deoxynucleotidase YfbR-like HD superfamily hydrolase